MGDPAFRHAVDKPVARGVEELEVGTLGEEPDRRQQLGDVILGDCADVAHAGMQRDSGGRPVHRLAGGPALKPQSRGLVDQVTGSEVDPELGCRLEGREVAGRQQPRVIKRRVATQGEVDQIAASPERDRERGTSGSFAVEPSHALGQRLAVPAGERGPPLDELPAEAEFHQLVLAVAAVLSHVRLPLLGRAVPVPARVACGARRRVAQGSGKHRRGRHPAGAHDARPVIAFSARR